MLDINLLRRDLPGVIAGLERRKSPQPFLDVGRYTALEADRKRLQMRTEELQSRRNALSKQIGQRKGKGEDATGLLAEVNAIADELKAGADALDRLVEDAGLRCRLAEQGRRHVEDRFDTRKNTGLLHAVIGARAAVPQGVGG